MAKIAEELGDDFQATVLRARRALQSAGELPLLPGPTTLPLPEDERAALVGLLRDGTYRRAVEEIAASDPDLADN